jgi:hypothetical protein
MTAEPTGTFWTLELPCGCVQLHRSGAHGYQTVSRNREQCDRTCQQADTR